MKWGPIGDAPVIARAPRPEIGATGVHDKLLNSLILLVACTSREPAGAGRLLIPANPCPQKTRGSDFVQGSGWREAPWEAAAPCAQLGELALDD
ncbi:hypothetical protein [Glutamicibacter halophytocola]|uniref:hypothetical protein n=1 Tax=Glutamicibacter halophytocola TaxID=1933880 RepID=UPI0015C561DD|nr:hypothetical protein [Glutamicibacter halophytocola]NQD41937.1 hypothetical protein [Glutamicibacter halophytocola]